ncbi:hypothetical protein BH11VER1_BH11VER1_39080 [soil metagenome]
MLRSIIAFTALAPLLFALSSCGSMSHLLKKSSKSAKTEAPEAPKDQVIGTIEMVNPEQHFVLVKTLNRMALAAGTKLESHSPNGGLKAVLMVTPEHKLNFISADIAEGYPQQGDIVIEIAVPKPPDTPAKPASDQPPPLEPFTSGGAPPPIVDLPLPEGQLPPPITPPSGT